MKKVNSLESPIKSPRPHEIPPTPFYKGGVEQGETPRGATPTAGRLPVELGARDIAPAAGVSRQAVEKRANKEKWPFVLRKNPRGGKDEKLYIVASLPPEWKIKVARHYLGDLEDQNLVNRQDAKESNLQSPRPHQIPLDPPLQGGKNSPPAQNDGSSASPIAELMGASLQTSSAAPGGAVTETERRAQPKAGSLEKPKSPQAPIRPRLLQRGSKADLLPAWAERIARARADLVAAWEKALRTMQIPLSPPSNPPHPLLQRGSRAKGEESPASTAEITKRFLDAYNSGLALPALFQVLGSVSRSTLERWRKRIREARGDCRALAPAWGARAGSSILTEAECNQFFIILLHPNRIKISKAIGRTRYMLQSRGIESPSGDAVFRRRAEKFKQQYFDVWTLAREGEKALFDKVLPYLERDDSLLEVGDVLVADGHRCNFFVHDPLTGKKRRPLLVGFYDWKSRDLAGYAFAMNEDAQVIAAALYRAILRLGKIPRIVLTDNGKAFKSRVFTEKPDIDLEQCGLQGMFGRLGIQTVFAMPYNARSKPIERFFLEFSESFERYLPAYSGGGIDDKPAYLLRNEKMMKEHFTAQILTVPQAVEALEAWLAMYRATPHPTVEGQRKIDVFEAGRGRSASGGAGINDDDLQFLMLHVEQRTIGRNGVTFLQANYYHESLYGLREKVVIRYDFSDLTRVFVYLPNGQFLCAATRVESTHPMARLMGGAKDMAELKHKISTQRSAKRGTRKIVEKIYAMGMNPELLDSLPYRAMPELAEVVERAQAEIEGPRAFAEIPEAEMPPLANCHAVLPGAMPDTAKESCQPLFETYVDHFAWLMEQARIRELTDEERKTIEELKRESEHVRYLAEKMMPAEGKTL